MRAGTVPIFTQKKWGCPLYQVESAAIYPVALDINYSSRRPELTRSVKEFPPEIISYADLEKQSIFFQ
jgi:hypothetical protein